MIVRSATAADAESILDIRVAAWRVAYQGFMPAEYLASLDARQGFDGLVKAIQSPEPLFQLKVAESKGAVLGFVIVGAPRYEALPHTLELRALNIRPDQWRQGAARLLLQAALEDTKAKRYARLELWCLAGNIPATALYESNGFVRTGESRTTSALTGHPLHEIAFANAPYSSNRANIQQPAALRRRATVSPARRAVERHLCQRLNRMQTAPRIQLVDHSALLMARQLHAVQMIAYAQEAKLLGAIYFPPLERTVEDVRTADEVFLAAFIDEKLVGATSIWPDPEGNGMNIASLVVLPQFQRRGIGAALLGSSLLTHGAGEITVQTGARNTPALCLYARAGFVEFRRWLVGREPLELVKLLRTPGVSSKRSTDAA